MRNTPRSVWAYDRDGGWNSRSIVCVKTRLAACIFGPGGCQPLVCLFCSVPRKREREGRLTVLVIGTEDSDQFPVVSEVDQHLFCGEGGPIVRESSFEPCPVGPPRLRLRLTVYEFDEGARGGELQVGERVHIAAAARARRPGLDVLR